MDCYRHWESVLFRSVPVVQNSSSLWPLLRDVSCFLLEDWTRPVARNRFLEFKPVFPARRRVVMAQYWYDRVNEDRREFVGDVGKRRNIY